MLASAVAFQVTVLSLLGTLASSAAVAAEAWRLVTVVTVGIVTHAEDFRLFGIVDVQRKLGV